MPSTISAVRVDGQKVRMLREMKLWTREELAERAGVSEDQIGRIERGTTKNPHMKTLRGLVDALDVEPTAFMAEGSTEVERGEPASQAEIVRELDRGLKKIRARGQRKP